MGHLQAQDPTHLLYRHGVMAYLQTLGLSNLEANGQKGTKPLTLAPLQKAQGLAQRTALDLANLQTILNPLGLAQ
jgi:hypothetical protein